MVKRRNRILGGLAAALCVVAALITVTGPASAADTASLAIRSVDATQTGKVSVTFLYTGALDDLKTMSIREEGEAQKIESLQTLRKAGVATATVWVVDTSAAMNKDGALAAVKKALKDQVATLEDGDEMGLVSFDDGVVVQSSLTTSKDQLEEAIDELNAPKDGRRAVNDAIRRASVLFERSKLQPNIVLVSAGGDTASSNSEKDAGAALSATDAALFVTDLRHDGGSDTGSLQRLINRYGGDIVPADDVAAIPAAFTSIGNAIDSQYIATYGVSGNRRGSIDLTLTVGNETRNNSYIAGGVSAGSTTVATSSTPSSFGPAFLRGTTGLLLIVIFVALAMALAVYAVVSLAGASDEGLSAMLRPYEEGVAPDSEDGQGFAQTALLQRAVELTEEIAERQGLLEKIERMLERADLPLRAAEALFFYAVAVIIVSVAGFAMFGFVNGLLLALLVALLPPAFVSFTAGRRKKAFLNLLPDTLHLLSGSLRAGYSLMQGVEAVSQEVEEPMGKELRRVVTEARLGREVEDALQAIGERMESPDFAWVVMAIRIQREVGGNLSELLLTVADTMVHRERLRRDVAALTAEGKMSAIILGLLPIGLGLFMYTANGDYMKPLFTTGLGKGLLLAACVSAGVGFAWMKKTINIKI